MVEVFKTNVERSYDAAMLGDALMQRFPHCRINFDLDDCDRILRVEGSRVLPASIVEVLTSMGFNCLPLE